MGSRAALPEPLVQVRVHRRVQNRVQQSVDGAPRTMLQPDFEFKSLVDPRGFEPLTF